ISALASSPAAGDSARTAPSPPMGARDALPSALSSPPAGARDSGSSASRHDAWSEGLDVRADLAGAGQPHAVAGLQAVLEGAAEPADPVRAPDDEGMEGDGAHERLARGLREHLIELVHDHLRELVGGVAVPDDAARIVHLDRIGHGEDPPLARADPHGLVV